MRQERNENVSMRTENAPPARRPPAPPTRWLRASGRFLFHTLGLRFLLALISAFALWTFVARDASPNGAPGLSTAAYRTVAVVAKLHGDPADGYGVTSVVVTPPAITVQGAALTLGDVSFVNTDVLDISGQATTTTRMLAVDLPPCITSTTVSTVTVSVFIAPIVGRVSANVPITLKGLGAGLTATLSPDAVDVTLNGPLPKLKSLSIRALVDVTGQGPGSYILPVQVATPSDITVQIAPADVTVTLTVAAPGASPTP
jgi:YbbR domain-containing protein